MTLFWIAAAALIAVVLLTLLLALRQARPAAAPDAGASNVQILRDQLAELDAERAAGTLADPQYAASRAELERRVLEEADAADTVGPAQRGRYGTIGMVLVLPLFAVGLYALLGNRDALDPILTKPAQQATAHDVETLVERLAQRMRDDPADPQGWALLGRAYSQMERFEDARDAFAQAVSRSPKDAQLLADYADALAMTLGQRIAGEPERQIQLALQIDPNNLKALALAGSAAMERRDPKAAIDFWARALKVAPEGGDFAMGLAQGLQEARRAAGLPELPVPAPAAIAGPVITGQVTLSPALLERIKPGDTLYVFARAAEGPRLPLAIQRSTVGDWPVTFRLDDSMAMSPQFKLSGFDRVVVGARVSQSGNATPQPGDLEGETAPLEPGAGKVELVIDRVRAP